MHRVGWKIFAVKWMALFAIFSVMLLNACDNSAEADADETTSSLQSSGSKAKSSSSKKAYPDSFKPNDKEYPYANIPRIVIYTENQQKIKDRETEIPAKLQIWGKKKAETEIFDLTIRGRGNTSWTDMPKKSYKIEFEKKQSMLGMPKDKDWALISNYADKTLMKNYLMYHLSADLGAYYAPRCEFVELYLNQEYLGVYLLTETIKIGKNRVNIPKDTNSYIVEKTKKYHDDDQLFFSYVMESDSSGVSFHVHNPKKASYNVLSTIKNEIEKFEKFLKTIQENKDNNIRQRLDVMECVKHYWVQEYSKNPDAASHSSIYFTWVKNDLIRMGPVWDFDLAFGGHRNESVVKPEKWHIKAGYWHSYIFKDSIANQARLDFWKENRSIFVEVIDVADSIRLLLNDVAKNNFKRWNVLKSTEYVFHRHSYDSYKDAVEDLKDWIRIRIKWIDEQI
ncbi:MAG: CotH kinase family protein [Fibrobacter sp.]|nr:CotH kinase family protein [Fibrobacter sp.]